MKLTHQFLHTATREEWTYPFSEVSKHRSNENQLEMCRSCMLVTDDTPLWKHELLMWSEHFFSFELYYSFQLSHRHIKIHILQQLSINPKSSLFFVVDTPWKELREGPLTLNLWQWMALYKEMSLEKQSVPINEWGEE